MLANAAPQEPQDGFALPSCLLHPFWLLCQPPCSHSSATSLRNAEGHTARQLPAHHRGGEQALTSPRAGCWVPAWCRKLPALAENLLLMWQGNEKAEGRACAAGFLMRHTEHKDMIFGSGSLLLCFVGSLLAALCLLTQALCVWHGPDLLGGAGGACWHQRPLPGTAINNSAPAAPRRAPVPSQGDLSGSLAWGMQQEDTAKKRHLYSNKAVASLPKKKII